MGYTTGFDGQLDFNHRPSDATIAALKMCFNERHDSDTFNGHNTVPVGKASLNCDWEFKNNEMSIYPFSDKNYGYVDWCQWIITNIVEKEENLFLNGTIYWNGEEQYDKGRFTVTNNVIKTELLMYRMTDALSDKQCRVANGQFGVIRRDMLSDKLVGTLDARTAKCIPSASVEKAQPMSFSLTVYPWRSDQHQILFRAADCSVHKIIDDLVNFMKNITGLRRHYLSGYIKLDFNDKTYCRIYVSKNKLSFETSEFVDYPSRKVSIYTQDSKYIQGIVSCMAYSSEPQCREYRIADDIRCQKRCNDVVASAKNYASMISDVVDRISMFRKFDIENMNGSGSSYGDLYCLDEEAQKLNKRVNAKRALISTFDGEFDELKTAINEYNTFATTHTRNEMFHDSNEPIRKRAYKACDAVQKTLKELEH